MQHPATDEGNGLLSSEVARLIDEMCELQVAGLDAGFPSRSLEIRQLAAIHGVEALFGLLFSKR